MRRPLAALRSLLEQSSASAHIKAIYLGVYTATLCTGIVTLISPPRTIEGEIGPALAAVWAAAFIGGGAIGLGTVLTPWWWLERVGLAVAGIGGLGVYAYVTLTLHATAPVGDSQLTHLGIATIAAGVYIARWAVIRAYSYQPQAPRRGR